MVVESADAVSIEGATSTSPDDIVLVGRMSAGDHAALAALYDRYGGIAYSVALRVLRDETLAEDAVQEAFLGAWRNASRYASERGPVRAWLLAIVHHRAVDQVRRRRPQTGLPDPTLSPANALTVPDVWPEVAGLLDAGLVREALARLPHVQRQAIELAYFGGLTQQEIARRTGAPLGTVKSRVRLGLLGLRSALSDVVCQPV